MTMYPIAQFECWTTLRIPSTEMSFLGVRFRYAVGWKITLGIDGIVVALTWIQVAPYAAVPLTMDSVHTHVFVPVGGASLHLLLYWKVPQYPFETCFDMKMSCCSWHWM